jgi:hypothetical protein
MTRYKDGYRVARLSVGLGTFFKVVGVIVGVVIAGGSVIAALSLGYAMSPTINPLGRMSETTPSLSGAGMTTAILVLVLGFAIAVVAGGLQFLLGVIVSAQGQILKAELDTAVNSSPFLVDQQRAQIMSL